MSDQLCWELEVMERGSRSDVREKEILMEVVSRYGDLHGGDTRLKGGGQK